jgi:hypothetical protein
MLRDTCALRMQIVNFQLQALTDHRAVCSQKCV